ncbi:MAG TPA: membrane protein insertase YidC [Candidatus Babeliales bacterium]|jgi:YidC/Oxa1 family membrane protein insertase|nr:membrane protein insertase YidC [Candidatus Babeliales bacterium]
MNMKDLVLPIGCAIVSMAALNYFFPGNSSRPEVESSFVAPKEKKEYKPLNAEVDFYDQKRVTQAQTTDCETEWGYLTFSTDGASLESIDFKRESNGQVKTIRTVFPVAETERAERCFLVALQDATPFYYTLLSSDENDVAYELMYVGGNDECVVQKRFVIDKNVPKIDLSVEVAPKNDSHSTIEPRVFFPAPNMPDLKGADVVSSIVIDQVGTFTKKQVEKLDVHAGWFKPELFGADDRYFIHSMISDSDHFAQRAYYKLEERTRLFSILEGPSVTAKTSWTLSFYFGPKELNALAAVDNRLEKTLDYSGMLSSLAKLMLYILNWLYKYLHNYGLAIIALTLLIQICLLPVSLRNGEEKFKKQQAEYQRQLALIEQRFAGNPEKLLAERTELIRKNGLPGLGCLLPLLIQLPIFFALSRVLSSSFELYQAPIFWIPDLSLKDPYYILPVLVVLTMLVQDMKGDPQQRMSKIVMAFVFGAITSSFSAGLTLYILMGRVFGFVQSKVMNYFKLV